jgi:GTP-binding protein HflX
LHEIDSQDKPTIVVFNKIDAFTYQPKDELDLTPDTPENISIEELKQTWMSKLHDNCIFISAKEKINIEELKQLLYQRAKEIHTARFPYNDFLYDTYDEES